jgi:hypothetical protein
MTAPGIAVNTAATIAGLNTKVADAWQCVNCCQGWRYAYMAPAANGSRIYATCARCGNRARGGRWKGYPLYGTFLLDPRGIVRAATELPVR